MITETYPLKWLLEQLPDYIPPAALAELLTRFEAQKQRYSRRPRGRRCVSLACCRAVRRTHTVAPSMPSAPRGEPPG